MKKAKKFLGKTPEKIPATRPEAEAPEAEVAKPEPVRSATVASEADAQLWALYLARVAKSETVATMRRDLHVIFREALVEAKAALEVWTTKEA